VVPPPLTNFSSDLDESQNRSLGQLRDASPNPLWLGHGKQAINDKLPCNVAAYLSGGVVNNQIVKGLLLSLSLEIFF